MPEPLRVRELSAQEVETIQRLVHSRTAAVRTVERARIIWLASEGQPVSAIAEAVGMCRPMVRTWIKRFNAKGVKGLADEPRSGRPATYTAQGVGEVIAASLANPRQLGLPFSSWTLDRLQAYLNEEKGIASKRGRIDEVLLAEGLRWRHQEAWFGEWVDPDFAAKRGPSPACTPNRLKAV